MNKLRSSSIFEKNEVVFHLRRPRIVCFGLGLGKDCYPYFSGWVGGKDCYPYFSGWIGVGWLEELELKQALQFCFRLGLYKMFLNFDGFGKCSSVSRIPRIPAFGRSDPDLYITGFNFQMDAGKPWLMSRHVHYNKYCTLCII